MCEIFQKRRTFGTSQFPFTLARKEVLDYSREHYPKTFEGLEHTLVLPWNENYTSEHVNYIAACHARSDRQFRLHCRRTHDKSMKDTRRQAALRISRRRTNWPDLCARLSGDAETRSLTAIVDINEAAAGDRWRSRRTARLVDPTSISRRAARWMRWWLQLLPPIHGKIAIDLLERGIPVLCEKPVSFDLETARQIRRTAREQTASASPWRRSSVMWKT